MWIAGPRTPIQYPTAMPYRIYYPRVMTGISGSSRACQRRMKPWRLMFQKCPGRWGTAPRTAGISSQLGSSVEDSLSSQKDHLNSPADRLHGKFLNYLGRLVTDMAGGNQSQGDETVPGHTTTIAYTPSRYARKIRFTA